MNLNQLFEAIDRFFLDIIGSVVPGAALIVGLWLFFDISDLPSSAYLLPPSTLFNWTLLVVAAYVTGYVVSSIGENIVLPVINKVLLERTQAKVSDRLWDDIKGSVEYRAMSNKAKNIYSLSEPSVNNKEQVYFWRDIALSSAPESSYLAWRFMFISLLNLGMATVALLLVVTCSLVWLLNTVTNSVTLSNQVPLWVLIPLFIASLLFLDRNHRFYERSMRLPFRMALMQLEKTEKETAQAERSNNKKLDPGAYSEEHEGTWWEDWRGWLEQRSGEQTDPPQVGSEQYPPLQRVAVKLDQYTTSN